MGEPAVRERFQDRLDAVVRDNRVTVAVAFPLAGAAVLVASAEGVLPPVLSFNPLLVLAGTLVMRLPLVAAVVPAVDRRAVAGLAALAAYAYAVEFVGVRTGWPYGEFSYVVDLGPMLFGEVPLGLPVFFVPLVLDSYLLWLLLLRGVDAGDARRPRALDAPWPEHRALPSLRGRRGAWLPVGTVWLRVPATVATVLVVDLVLDPAAVAVGFWSYAADGAYYGVPWRNYAGWALSATVAVGVVEAAFDPDRLRERVEATSFSLDDLVSFVLLWGAVNVAYANWLPVVVAAALFAAVLSTDRVDLAALRRRWLPSGGR